MIPYGRQDISDDDVSAIVAALKSDFLTQGPLIERFEEAFAEAVGARYAIATNSATAALHIAMLAAGIGPRDRVVTSPNTFVASANCAAYVGAIPDFSDIHPISYNLDPVVLEREWKDDTRAVVAVDYAGQPADLPEISRIAKGRGAVVIEDACHGVGGAFRHGGSIWRQGGNPWADMATFSFHPVKTMTTGEGGMLVTNNEQYAIHARRIRSHGIVRNPSEFIGLTDTLSSALTEQGSWYYEMQELGFNYRITDFQCALGLSQLQRLTDFIRRRQEIVGLYNEAFSNVPWIVCPALLEPASAKLISWHLYSIQIDFTTLGKTRSQVMSELRDKGVGTQVLYIPVYLQPWYRRMYGYMQGKCPVAEDFYTRALALPLYPAMKQRDVSIVIQSVRALEP